MSDRTDAMSDSELLALARKAQEVAPGAWEKDSIRTEGEYGTGDETHSGFDAFQMFAGDKVLFDSANSDASVIETEFDEDSFVHAWDETARKVFAYIAAANPAAITVHMLEKLALRAEVERLTRERDEARTDQAIANNLARAELAKREAAESALAAAQKRVGELEKAGRAVFEYFFGSIVCRPSRDPDMEYELLSELRAALAGPKESDNG